MALRIGSKAPDFTLASTSGSAFTLSKDLAGQALLLFFYPKDFTRTCQAEVCSFRNSFAQFQELGLPVVGISRDDIPTHKRFKAEFHLPYDLLSDLDLAVSKAYGATIPFVGLPNRTTFLLDSNHRIVYQYSNLLGADVHIEKTIAFIAQNQFEGVPASGLAGSKI